MNISRKCQFLLTAVLASIALLGAKEVPRAIVWQFDGTSLSRKKYLKDVDFISRNLDVDTIAIAPVANVNVGDTDQFHDSFKELVEYAAKKGIRTILRREPGTKGFFNSSVDGADEGTYIINDQSEAQGIAYADEAVADKNGFAKVVVTAKWARNKVRPLRNELLRVYAFDRSAEGFYQPDSLVDVTANARVSARTSKMQTIEVDCGGEFAGKTIYVMTCQYFNSLDLFGDACLRYHKRIMDSLADIPLAGYYQDESGYMVLDSRNIRKGVTPAWRGLFFSRAMEGEWRKKYGRDLVRTLFDMRYAPVGDESVRIRAINSYIEFMRMKPLEMEREIVAHQKRIWGEDVFLACHSTFHNNLEDDEVWKTGCDWWDVPRDFGFTDERTDYPTRMGVLMSAKEPKLLHMFYSKHQEDYYREMVELAPFNGRIFLHAYNDGVWGQGFDETETPFLKNVGKLMRAIRHLDGFQRFYPKMDLLVVFGTAAQFNWYPDHTARNLWDVDGSLGVQRIVRNLWADGYRCALVPDTMILDGRLKITSGQFDFNGHMFSHCLYLYPKYAKKRVYGFLNSAFDAGMPLAVVGSGDIDFDAKPASFHGKSYGEFTRGILDDIRVQKTVIPGGAVYEDGSFALVSLGIIDRTTEKFDFVVEGKRYSGHHTGLLAYRKGDRAFATSGSTLRCDGKEISLVVVSAEAPDVVRESTNIVSSARPDLVEKVKRGELNEARASWWGFDKDDSTESLQAAINSKVKTLIVDNVGNPWIVRPVHAVSNQRIVFEDGVMLLAKAGEFKGREDCLMTIARQSNVVLSGTNATLRMRRADYCAAPYKFGQWRHALSIIGSQNVRVEGLTFEQSGGDGICIAPLSGKKFRAVDITIRNVVCDGNLRQGMSVIGAENLLVENSVFRNTKGAPPEAGIDFEPNGPDEPLLNCSLRNCTMEGNTGDGVDIIVAKSDLTTPPLSIRFENCTIKGNRRGLYYHDGRIPRDGLFACDGGEVCLLGCAIESNRQNAVFARHKQFSSARMHFRNCRFVGNCTGTNAMADVDVAATGHRSMKPNVFVFDNVKVIQNAARPWISTTGDGLILKGNPTRFSGSVDIVGADGEIRDEQLDEEWMKGHFRWEKSHDPPIPPRIAPRLGGEEVVDNAPGELLPLPEVMVRNGRFSAAYAFFAAKAGNCRLCVKQFGGKNREAHGLRFDVFSYRTGERVGKVSVPASLNVETINLSVPERGCYRFDAPGRRVGFAVVASSVPLAIDMTKGVCPFTGCEKSLYFYVDGSCPFAYSINGDGREGLKSDLVDPAGCTVWSRSLTGDVGDVYISGDVPRQGLWRAEIRKADGIFFEDHSIGLSGINAFLFLSKDRYWYVPAKYGNAVK